MITTTTTLIAGPKDRNWMSQAVCAQTDPEAFFPDQGGASAIVARICSNCPVQGECLEYAQINHISYGVWGGLSSTERGMSGHSAAG